MKLQEIEQLVNKYYEGESTLDEEKQLKEYFTSNEVPEHLQMIQDQLTYFTSSEVEIPDAIGLEDRILTNLDRQRKHEKSTPRIIGRIITAIAATVLLVFAVQSIQQSFTTVSNNDMTTALPLETCVDKEKCEAEVEKALVEFSTVLNQLEHEDAKKGDE
jgi:hypothetical protein